MFVRKLEWKSPVGQNSHLIFFISAELKEGALQNNILSCASCLGECRWSGVMDFYIQILSHNFFQHLRAPNLEKASKLATLQVKPVYFHKLMQLQTENAIDENVTFSKITAQNCAKIQSFGAKMRQTGKKKLLCII